MTKYTFPIRINGRHTADAEVSILNHRIVGCDVTTVGSYTLPLSDQDMMRIGERIVALSVAICDDDDPTFTEEETKRLADAILQSDSADPALKEAAREWVKTNDSLNKQIAALSVTIDDCEEAADSSRY